MGNTKQIKLEPVLVTLLWGAEAALLKGDQESLKAHLRVILGSRASTKMQAVVVTWLVQQMRMRLNPRDGRLDHLALSRALPPQGVGRAPAVTRLLMVVDELGLSPSVRQHLIAQISKTPADAGLQLLGGQLALTVDDRPSAERYLRRAIELGFPSPTPLLGLAQLAVRQSNAKQQRELLTKAAAAFPLFVDPRGSAKAERLLILNALPRPWCSDWRDAYNHSNLIRSYAPLAGQAHRAIDVLMLGGISLDQIQRMALPPTSTILNNIGNAEIMERDGYGAKIHALGKRLGVRLLNRPEAVLKTSRAGNYSRFGSDSRFVFPKTQRFMPAMENGSHDADAILAEFDFPVILRGVFAHEGKQVHLCKNSDELREALARFQFADVYAIAFHDCQVDDGLWRKFRCLCIGGEVIPSSVHYSDEWNVHLHRSRDIAARLANVEIVKAKFREQPSAVIGDSNWTVIKEICAGEDLDIFGIDFGFDREGRLVVFEINANMRADPILCRPALDRLFWRTPVAG